MGRRDSHAPRVEDHALTSSACEVSSQNPNPAILNESDGSADLPGSAAELPSSEAQLWSDSRPGKPRVADHLGRTPSLEETRLGRRRATGRLGSQDYKSGPALCPGLNNSGRSFVTAAVSSVGGPDPAEQGVQLTTYARLS